MTLTPSPIANAVRMTPSRGTGNGLAGSAGSLSAAFAIANAATGAAGSRGDRRRGEELAPVHRR